MNKQSGKNNPSYKHGYAMRENHHPLYDVYRGMKSRCFNSNFKCYHNYGGRGITICSQWLDDPGLFVKWGEENGYEKGLQIDRKDNDGNYEPSNCRFVTSLVNNENKRRNKKSGRFIGVRLRERMKSFTAQINHKGNKRIGTYTNEIDAAVARDSYVISNNLNRRLNFEQPIMEINQWF